MSRILIVGLMLGSVAATAACDRREPTPEYVQPQPITPEPTYNKL